MEPGRAVLLYDGACGLCASSVQFVLRHESRQDLLFAPLQGELAADVRAQHPELAAVDSMVWVEDGRTFVRSAAVLRTASYLGGIWKVAALGWLVPRAVRDMAYDFVARHRHQWFGAEQCYLPPPDVRKRFLA